MVDNTFNVAGVEVALRRKQDFDGGNQPVYIGEALPNHTDTSKAYWRIQKRVYDGSGKLIDIIWANNDGNFNKVWDNRSSYTYT